MDRGWLLSPNQIVLHAYPPPQTLHKACGCLFHKPTLFFIDIYSLQRDFAAWQMNVEHSQVLFQTEDQFQSQYKCLLFSFNIVWKFQFACCSRKDLKRGKKLLRDEKRKNFQRVFSGENGSPWSTHYCIVTKEEYRNRIQLFSEQECLLRLWGGREVLSLSAFPIQTDEVTSDICEVIAKLLKT